MTTDEESVPGTLTRRSVLARVVSLPLALALPAAAVGCAHGPSCNETGNLSADDLKIRTEVAAYVEQSTDPTKHCSACQQFVAGPSGGCGSCKIVKGPINPGGSCKLFVAKQG
jgi:hypothetical protein